MPITFFPPPGPQLIGPGIVMSWGSDFIGPLPSDARWDITVQLPGEPYGPWLEASRPCLGSHVGLWTPFVNGPDVVTLALGGNEIQDGAACTATVLLMSGASVLDSGTLEGTYEATTGLPIVMQNELMPTTGGFTSTDRANLDLALVNSIVQLPINAIGGLVNVGLGRLFNQVPGYVLRRHGSIHLTGDGSLNRGTEPFASYSMGIEWLFDAPPAGFGFSRGNVLEYERRMVQWQPVFETPLGETYWDDLVDAHENGQRVVWGPYTPRVLNYSIAPGVGLTLWFLVFNALP